MFFAPKPPIKEKAEEKQPEQMQTTAQDVPVAPVAPVAPPPVPEQNGESLEQNSMMTSAPLQAIDENDISELSEYCCNRSDEVYRKYYERFENFSDEHKQLLERMAKSMMQRFAETVTAEQYDDLDEWIDFIQKFECFTFQELQYIGRLRTDEAKEKYRIQKECIQFEFPQGFTQLRLIEECRALNALDLQNPDNFDLMFDITMQMLVGKIVVIHFREGKVREELARFVVTDRYMNLRGVDIIDEYPVLVNWLVEFIAGYLGKKYPRSLKDYQAVMSVREERLKSLNK